METLHFLDLFQGIATLVASEPKIMIGRILLMLLGFILIYLGSKGVLEPLLMIPMGLGMSSINAGVMFLDSGKMGTLFVDPLMSEVVDLVNIMQVNWLQPIYTLTFSNGLIACFIFMGIGVLLDVGYVMARPFQSMIIALFAELGTFVVFPLAIVLGLTEQEAASVATIGGADGPMVLFTSLVLAKNLFVPITVVGYLYLGLAYGGFPYLIKWLVPERLRGIDMSNDPSSLSDLTRPTKAISVSEANLAKKIGKLIISKRDFCRFWCVFPTFHGLWTQFGCNTAMRFRFHARQTSVHSV